MTFEDANWNVFIEKKGIHNRINEKCEDHPLHSLSLSQGTSYQLEHPPFWIAAVKDQSFPSFCYLYSSTRRLRDKKMCQLWNLQRVQGVLFLQQGSAVGLGHPSVRGCPVHVVSVEAVDIEADYRCWQNNKEKRETVTIWFG